VAERLLSSATFSDMDSEEHVRFTQKITEFQKILMDFRSCTQFVWSGVAEKLMQDDLPPLPKQ